ncbi:MAG: histidinol dehydrogenase, partial [Spirochaetaceae bacterium]|nr:histidinol dehydrogenase [Spirochaetaceae bacterium]
MNINYKIWSEMSSDEKNTFFSRSEIEISDVLVSVNEIINNVKENGDRAIFTYNQLFDKVEKKKYSLLVTEKEFEKAEALLDTSLKDAIDYSITNVWEFHKSQKPESMNMIEIRKGIFAGEKSLPIESAGLYVPRGRGSFPSMLYMQAIPAKVAG